MQKDIRQKRFSRPSATRVYKKVFHVFMEGEKTEPRYFGGLKKQYNHIQLELHPSRKKTSALQILNRAKAFLAKDTLGINDEIWLVIDVDDNKKEDLELLLAWAEENKNYGIALSNPKFEYWLLLHFEKGHKVQSSGDCDLRLDQHLGGYSKTDFNVTTVLDNIENAIDNAAAKYKQCQDWFHDYHTTVFQLVGKILSFENHG